MKEKIMYLILGILIGAVITAGCFLIFSKNNNQEMNGRMGGKADFENMTDEEREEMMEKHGDGDFNGEKPDGAPEENGSGEATTENTSTSDTTTDSTENS